MEALDMSKLPTIKNTRDTKKVKDIETIRISLGGNVKQPRLVKKELSLESFYNSLIQIDDKYSKNKTEQPFFCATADYNPLYKSDDNLSVSAKYDIIVIDGDSGIDEKPISTEKEVHLFLKGMGYNHFILSSWGKGYDKKTDAKDESVVKWRAIIQAEGVNTENLENTSRSIVGEMQKAGLSISYAYENHTLVRAWFFGGMFDKSLFKHHSYFHGKSLKFSTETVKVKESEAKDEPEALKSQKLADIVKILDEGGDGYHPAQNKFSTMMAKDGVNQAMIKTLLYSSMERWKDGSKRWQERFDNVEKSVNTAYDKINQSEAEAESESDTGVIDYVSDNSAEIGCMFEEAPGVMKYIIQECDNRMYFPVKQIAVLSALHSVATFAGNIYSCDGVLLTQKRVLLAKSGSGKNSVSSWMNYLIQNIKTNKNLVQDHHKIPGGSGYTSFKPLHLELQDFPVKSIIINEAGKAGKSKMGDPEALESWMLTLLSIMGNDVLMPKGMVVSKENAKLKPLYNLNVQILSESVPDSYIENMMKQGDIKGGNLSRSELIMINPRKELVNNIPRRNKKSNSYKVDGDIMGIFNKLFSKFMKFGNKDATVCKNKFVEIKKTEEVEAAYDKLTLDCRLKSLSSEDEFDNALANRKHEKTLRTAMILAIAESAYKEISGTPIITMVEWNWACSYQNEIIKVLKQERGYGAFGDALEKIKNNFIDKLKDIGKSKTYIRLHSKKARELKVINGSMLSELVYKTSDFRDYTNGSCFKDKNKAINNFIGYCNHVGILERIIKDDHNKYGVRKAPAFIYSIR